MTSSPSSLSTHLWAYSPCSSSLPSSTSLYVVLSPLRPSPEGTSSRFLTVTDVEWRSLVIEQLITCQLNRDRDDTPNSTHLDLVDIFGSQDKGSAIHRVGREDTHYGARK